VATPPQANDFGLELLLLDRKRLGGDDRRFTLVAPAGRRGSWNAELDRDRQVAGLLDEFAEPMVVGAPGPCHRRIIADRSPTG